jgi:hypothetical protein
VKVHNLLALSLLILPASSMFAAPVFTWSFDQATGTVTQTDLISISATLMNTGSDPIGGPAGDKTHVSTTMQTLFDGTFNPLYSFYWDSQALLNINQSPLLPSQSLSFLLGVLTPRETAVPTGAYSIDSASIGLGGSSSVAPSNNFSREVTASSTPPAVQLPPPGANGSVPPTVTELPRESEQDEAAVPEPSSFVLLGGALIALSLGLRKARP